MDPAECAVGCPVSCRERPGEPVRYGWVVGHAEDGSGAEALMVRWAHEPGVAVVAPQRLRPLTHEWDD